MTVSFYANDIFVKRLSDLLATENISHRELCQKVGIQRKSLYCWLKGRNYPQYDSLIKLADYFKVSINYLLGISDDAYIPTHCTLAEVPNQFSSKLLAYMEEKSLTRYAFAKQIGIGQSTLNRWFKCNSIPDISIFIKISKITGISVDNLLGYYW